LAVTRPMPELAPVTIATLSERRPVPCAMSVLRFGRANRGVMGT
jgi:hypothetical protein